MATSVSLRKQPNGPGDGEAEHSTSFPYLQLWLPSMQPLCSSWVPSEGTWKNLDVISNRTQADCAQGSEAGGTGKGREDFLFIESGGKKGGLLWLGQAAWEDWLPFYISYRSISANHMKLCLQDCL